MPRSMLTALALMTIGCNAMDADPTLRTFESCDEMESYMKDMARQEARWSWSFQTRGVGFASTDMALESSGAQNSADDGDGGASSYSTTNLQELGVDEDDLVKTDGEYLYSLAGGYLVISKAWPLEEAAMVSKIRVDGTPSGLYLLEDSDEVVVLSKHYPYYEGPAPRSGARPERSNAAYTQVTLVDISDLEAPQVLRETYTTGELKSSRRIDNRLFVVTYEDIQVGDYADTLRETRKEIKEASFGAWLPRRMDNKAKVLQGGSPDEWEVEEVEACACNEVWFSDRQGGTFITHVSSLDLSDPAAEFKGTAVTGRADVVYSSPNAIYVGYSEWDEGIFKSNDSRLDTVLHKFDISDAAAKPTYLATGQVEGVLSDQFALSEKDGVLRVATTIQGSNSIAADWNSAVYTLVTDQQGTFDELDHVDGLAPGEEIFAARFVGNIGYLVTYEVRLGDPLFTIDMTDPSNLRVAGELAVTGWSDYIHPMDEDHLLTIGMDEGDASNDWGWGLAVSIFDVSDLDDPVLQSREVIDSWGSEAQWEHHAFNYFPEQEALAVPSWSYDGYGALEVFDISLEDGVGHIGTLTQQEVVEQLDNTWCAEVRRSVMMEDKVWAVGSAGLTAAAIDTPEDTLSAVPFDGVDPCESYYYY